MIKKIFKKYLWLFFFVLLTIFSFVFGFQPGEKISANFLQFFIEMIIFVPFVFILVGLFDVWFPKEKIQKHIGKEAGIKGMVLVILLAMLQAGPLYGAFPVAYVLYKKGAGIKNIFIYMGAFSTVKIPMLGIEIGYLGWEFSLIRSLIALPCFILIGYLMEWFLKDSDFQVKRV